MDETQERHDHRGLPGAGPGARRPAWPPRAGPSSSTPGTRDALDAAAARACPRRHRHRLPGDITDPAHRAALCAGRRGRGGLDLLVNNAGTLGASPLPAIADYPADELRPFEVNVVAPIALTQLLLPLLRRRGGAVLNITSDAAVEAYAGWGGYGAAKAALEQASNILAAEETRGPGLVGGPGRPADRHAPAGLPRGGHLGPAAARDRGARVRAADRRAHAQRAVPRVR